MARLKLKEFEHTYFLGEGPLSPAISKTDQRALCHGLGVSDDSLETITSLNFDNLERKVKKLAIGERRQLQCDDQYWASPRLLVIGPKISDPKKVPYTLVKHDNKHATVRMHGGGISIQLEDKALTYTDIGSEFRDFMNLIKRFETVTNHYAKAETNKADLFDDGLLFLYSKEKMSSAHSFQTALLYKVRTRLVHENGKEYVLVTAKYKGKKDTESKQGEENEEAQFLVKDLGAAKQLLHACGLDSMIFCKRKYVELYPIEGPKLNGNRYEAKIEFARVREFFDHYCAEFEVNAPERYSRKSHQFLEQRARDIGIKNPELTLREGGLRMQPGYTLSIERKVNYLGKK